jgi:hypothetical protein
MRARWCGLVVGLTGCAVAGDPLADIQYRWDDSRVLCSRPIDDLPGDDINKIGYALAYAEAHQTTPLFHAHTPTETVSFEQLFCMLDLVGRENMEYVTFRDFDQGTRRESFALSFDDEAVDQWYALRGLFRSHGAHVTFFVAGYNVWTDEQRAELAELAAEGHDIEAHGVNHLFADHYLVDHTVEEYVEQEVLPSIAMLEQAGFPITTFAFPGGASTPELSAAVLQHVKFVRVGGASCPE